jgi:hypothetical protein
LKSPTPAKLLTQSSGISPPLAATAGQGLDSFAGVATTPSIALISET